jgi:hypothetical protein
MTNGESRVLGRRGARIVTETEINTVNGGIQRETETLCSIGATGPDGDLFTGDCIAN